MKVSHRELGALAQISGISTPRIICPSCQQHNPLPSRRGYAYTATATQEAPAPSAHHTNNNNTSTPSGQAHRPYYRVQAGIVLSRPPIITRDLHPLESAYFMYQRRLNERLALPFSRYFYFKKDTPADQEWKRKARDRITAAREIGVYGAYTKEGWNDELLVGAKESERDEQVEALLRDSESTGAPAATPGESGALAGAPGEEDVKVKKNDVERPMPRVTEADEKKDVRSLNRALQRSLYLVVKDAKDGRWKFPAGDLLKEENMKEGAARILHTSTGPNMNIWLVGNHPVGHYVRGSVKADGTITTPQTEPAAKSSEVELGEKAFFMKGRIMAGQVDLSKRVGDAPAWEDFRWLEKEEVQKLVGRRYWSFVEGMLAER